MLQWPAPVRHLIDLLLPPACAGCDQPLYERGTLFCRPCAERMLCECGADYCPRCGETAEPYLINREGCRQCRHRGTKLSGFARAGIYDGVMESVILRFKFGRQQRLDAVLGALVADAIRGQLWSEEIEAIVPVPTDRSGWLRYRFHPAGLIARCAGRSLHLPVLPLVHAHGKRRRQTGLSHTERAVNIRGAFRVAKGARVEGARLCVVDDVSTSGATVREMARVLKAAGAAHVFAAVTAKTQLEPVRAEAALSGAPPPHSQ